jgi:DNA-binding MarR family transcriptional regulator
MDLFKSPGLLINRTASVMTNELERKFKVHVVTPSQWAILAVLWQCEGIPQVDIQQSLNLEGATVTGILKRMEKAGLIRRKVDIVDKRVQLVYLTEHGRSLEDILIPDAIGVNAMGFPCFTQDERETFVMMLTRILHNVNIKNFLPNFN